MCQKKMVTMDSSVNRLLCGIVLFLCVKYSDAYGNSTIEDEPVVCQDGFLLPAWRPLENLSTGDRVARGFVYLLILVYMFIAVSILCDRFMGAIEVITSKEKEVKIKKKSGETHIVVVRVWNTTVANLSLMALGTSAPEILLSVIEIFAKNFEAGELGPGTIVGSAAYNLFIIMAISIMSVPMGEVRKIKHLRVFIVTAIWSIFAYVWLFMILSVISPGRVEAWEGFLTFLFFPLTVLTAYIADKRLLFYKYLDKNYRMNKHGMIVQTEGGRNAELANGNLKGLEEDFDPFMNEEVRDFEQTRYEYISTLKDLRKKYPQATLEQLEQMTHERLLNKIPKSRAFYRIQATRKLFGSSSMKRRIHNRAQQDMNLIKSEMEPRRVNSIFDNPTICRVYFHPGYYTVMESCGTLEISVARSGDLTQYVTVEYETEDGSAEAGPDYTKKKGVLSFFPGMDVCKLKIEIIDDDIFEPDKHFYVRLKNISDNAVLDTPNIATVMILDDDHTGIFAFNMRDHELSESVGTYDLVVQRYSGTRGKVKLPYWTEDGTAKAGRDYIVNKGELLFDNNEFE